MLVFVFVLLSMLSAPWIWAAQVQDEEALKPVLVTSTRLKGIEEDLSKVPGKVVVITKDDIKESGAKTVQEALQYQTGIVLYDQIGNEYQSTVDLRGFNGQPVPGTTVFVDGVRVNEPDFNTVNFDFIPVENIEKIEIIYGPGTVYGRNALAGVINITMKQATDDRWVVGGESGGGSYGRQKHNFYAEIPLPLPNLKHYFSGSRELSDGYRQESDGRMTRIYNKLGYSDESGTDWSLSHTVVDDRIEQAGSLTQPQLNSNRRDNATPGDFKDSLYNLVTLNARKRLPAGFSIAMNSYYRNNNSENFVVGLTSVSDANTDYDQWGGTLQLSNNRILEGRNTVNVGVEYGNNRFTTMTTGNFGGAPFTIDTSTDEDAVGIFLLNQLNIFDSLSVTGGFRYDWDRLDYNDRVTPTASFTETFNHVSPRAGVAYNPLPNLGFYFSYAEGFRTPTVAELPAFDPPLFTPAVAPLDPVTSQNFEVGARGKPFPWLDGSLAFFYTRVKDEILFVVTDPATFSGSNVNISRSLRRGVELSLKARYESLIDGFINYTYTKATFETDILLFSGQVKKGDQFPLVPNHRVGVGVNVHPTENFTVSLFGDYVGSQFLSNDEPNDFDKLDEYYVLNGKMSYRWNNMTAYITGSNLTNNKFETFGIVGGFPAQPFLIPFPTTTVFAGMTFRYDGLSNWFADKFAPAVQ